MEECVQCRTALIDLQAILFQVEHELRGSVAPEALEHRIASWKVLERALYPPKTYSGFPLRWSAVYSVAAALTMAVLAGYLSTQTPAGEEPTQLAQSSDSDQTLSVAPAGEPSRSGAVAPRAPAQETAITAAAVPGVALVAEVNQPERGPSNLEAGRAGRDLPPAVEVPAAPSEPATARPQLVRFQMDEWIAAPSRAEQAPHTLPRPEFSLRPMPAGVMASNLLPTLWMPQPVGLEAPVPSRDWQPARGPGELSAEGAAGIIEGHWILTRARVWQEDIHPVWTSSGLRFEGTVEDETVRRRVVRAVERASGELPVRFALALRSGEERIKGPAPRRVERVVDQADRRPAGGAVRRSLLGHFSDAARRSFLAPEPGVLEAELDRYVSDVLRAQTRLLSHVYALNRLLRVIPPDRSAEVPKPAARKLRDVVNFHAAAVAEQEAHIYDRLSEALPRNIWTYHVSKNELSDGPNWQTESESLLRETLQLDLNLTALLSSGPTTIDASEVDFSCGELLHRIRTRVGRIDERMQALR